MPRLALLHNFGNLFFILSTIAVVLVTIGGQWDMLLHVTTGHALFAVPHLMVLSSIVIFGIINGLAVSSLLRTKAPSRTKRATWVMAVSTAILILGVPLDELWHRLFGLSSDMTAWSPPHLVMIGGMFGATMGVFTLEAGRRLLSYSSHLFSKDFSRILFPAALMFIIVLFFFIDFNLPSQTERITSRPGYTYPLTLIFATTFLSVFTASLVKLPWLLTISASLAWGFYSLVGLTICLVANSFFTFPPFPLFIGALAFDAFLVLSTYKKYEPHSIRTLSLAVLCHTVATYIGIVIWATKFTKLPQQLSGTSADWALWSFTIVPVSAIIATVLAWFLARLVSPSEARDISPERCPTNLNRAS